MEDGLGFFGSLALGRIASAVDSAADWRAAEDLFRGMRHRAELADQQGALGDVIAQYNQLVDEHNRVADVARQWMRWGDERKREIAQLKQDLAQANQRAQHAESQLAAVQDAKRLTVEKLDSLEKSHRFAAESLERLRSEYDDLAWAHKRLKEGGAT